jgi:hypothetical protein
MRVHIKTLGPADLSDLAHTARIDQALDLVVSDHPSIEITLDNGAKLELKPDPSKPNSIIVTALEWGDLVIAPRGGNQCAIVTMPAQQHA